MHAREIGARRNTMVNVGGRALHTLDDLYDQPPLGDMFSNLTASYDPIFWPIHVNIDRIWWEWQKRNPNSLPADLELGAVALELYDPRYAQRRTIRL